MDSGKPSPYLLYTAPPAESIRIETVFDGVVVSFPPLQRRPLGNLTNFYQLESVLYEVHLTDSPQYRTAFSRCGLTPDELRRLNLTQNVSIYHSE